MGMIQIGERNVTENEKINEGTEKKFCMKGEDSAVY
jgi:hypothetical protein